MGSETRDLVYDYPCHFSVATPILGTRKFYKFVGTFLELDAKFLVWPTKLQILDKVQINLGAVIFLPKSRTMQKFMCSCLPTNTCWVFMPCLEATPVAASCPSGEHTLSDPNKTDPFTHSFVATQNITLCKREK